MAAYSPFMLGRQMAQLQAMQPSMGMPQTAMPNTLGNNMLGSPMMSGAPQLPQTGGMGAMGAMGQMPSIPVAKPPGPQTPMTNSIAAQIPGLLKMFQQQQSGGGFSPSTIAGNAMSAQDAANNFYGMQGVAPGSFVP